VAHKPVANRGNPNSVLKATPCTLDVPRWRGDLKAGRCPRSEVVALCEALRAARWTERDVETNPTGSRCVVASVVLRYTCVCARCVSQLTSQIIRIPTPVESSHAPAATPGSSRAGGQRWQRQRRAQARSAPDRQPTGARHQWGVRIPDQTQYQPPNVKF
jgi:hypothetical protein